MKNNFFAKLGNFFLVSAVLFNGFGVGLVSAEYADTISPTFSLLLDNVKEGNLGQTTTYNVGVRYNGPVLVSDYTVEVIFYSVLGDTFAEYGVDYEVPNSVPNLEDYSYFVTFTPATQNDELYVPVNVIGNDDINSSAALFKYIIFTIKGLTVDQTDQLFALSIEDDDIPTIVEPIFTPATSVVYEGVATGANVTKLVNNHNTDLIYTIEITGDALLEQDFGLSVIDEQNISTPIMSNFFNLSVPRNSSSTFSVSTNNIYDNSSFDNVAKQTIWTVTNAYDGSIFTDYNLSSSNINFTLDIKDEENDLNFLNAVSSVAEGTSLNDSNSSFVYNNGTDNNVSLTFELSGTASSLTDYTVRTNELSSGSTWVVPKNSIKSFPVDILNVTGEKNLVLAITKIDLLNDNGTIKNGNITPILPNAQTHTLTILDTVVPPVNHAPVAIMQPIFLGNVNVGSTSTPVSFSTTFSDPDSDVLTYSVELSNPAIATSQITAGELVLTGTSVGTTTVTMTATDPDGLSASTTFNLTVVENNNGGGNNAPTVNIPIATQYIDLYVTSTLTINNAILQNLFSDADVNDIVGISLTNNTDATVVTTTPGIEFSSLMLTGLKVGASVIELTGDDTHGGIVTSTFAVVVSDSTPVEGNNAPTLSTVNVFVDNEISLQETLGANLHLYFEDVDVGDTLTFSAITTNASIVTSGIDAVGQLTLTPHNYGTVQVIVTATDSHGASISDTFSLKVNTPPELTANTLVNKQIDLKVSSNLLIDGNTIRGAFIDQDQEILTISVSDNSDNTVVTTTLGEDSSLTLLGLKVGTSTIEITADDGYETTSTTFLVTVVNSTSEETTGNNGGNTGSSSGSSGGGGSALLSNTAPQAAVTNGQEVTVEVNKEITFDASQSTDKENNIRFYFWNFGDGSEEVYYTVPTVKHTYNKISNYTLISRVRDAYGAESSSQVKVNVVAGKASTNTGTSNNTSNTNTESETTIETTIPTTDTTTSVDETVSTGTTNNNSNTNTNTNNNNSANNIEEDNSFEEEIIEESTIEEENNSFEEDSIFENIKEESIKETPVGEVEEMPTWIKIIFGSGALAAVAGAGIAVNRVRKGI
ncbi:MAG: PKD domain-containing protein [Patescibacteria group bacterium]|nr:PKD domain-containing protein [Patescibacteria group bacterium]